MAIEEGNGAVAEERFDAAAAVESLKSEMADVQESALLGDVRDSMTALNSRVINLPMAVQKLRGRGYVYGRGWEDKVQSLTARWQEARPRVEQEMQHYRKNLQIESDSVAARVNRLFDRSSETQVKLVEGDVEAFEAKVEATKNSLREMFDDIESEVSNLENKLRHYERIYERIDTATFQLLAGEVPVDMVEGRLMRDEKEGYKGYLFLTNQRVIFEQDEEIATKKVLFIATKKEKVQKVLLEEPVGRVEKMEDSEKGGFIGIGKKDFLELFFSSDAARPRVLFHLKGDSEKWRGLFQRVISGDFDHEMIAEAAETLAEEKAQVANVPTVCPNCGGPLDQNIARGVQSITCDYCGNVIRIG